MKALNNAHRLYLILLIVIVSGCVNSSESLATPTPEISILLTSNIAPTSSFMPIPVPTDSPITTPTTVIMPTLPVEEARTRLLDLLASNGHCQLPCLWGLIPGETSFQEARAVLIPLSGLSDTVHLDISVSSGSISPRYAENDLEIYTDIRFLVNLDDYTIYRFAFRAEAHKPLVEDGLYMGYENVFDSEFFSDTVSAYMLPQILSIQGVPESALIHTSGAPLTRGGTGGFEIVLLYPSQGVFVHYTTQMNIIGKNVRGCPQNAHVWMELYPSGDTDNFFAQLEKTNWPYFKNGFKPLEETTSMSKEEFYETFRVSTDKCIYTLASLWPIPEP